MQQVIKKLKAAKYYRLTWKLQETVPEGQTEIRRVIEKSVERHTLTSTVVLFSSSALDLPTSAHARVRSLHGSFRCVPATVLVSCGSGGGGACQSSAVVVEQL